MNDKTRGMFNKFAVSRADGRDGPGEKHEHCAHFVLDLDHDKHALPAIAAYAESCKGEFPQLAADLRTKVLTTITADNAFVTVPDVTLPNGTLVPSFQVGQYLCTRGPMGIPLINAGAAPWVEINYHEARSACEAIDGKLITELQYLAIAHDITQQDINWSGGKVGEGAVFQGLHLGTVDEAQPGEYVSGKESERRWHQLSNGQRVFDFAGNVYSWVFDNIQGDEQGVVTQEFSADSPSITTAPYPSKKNGMGWRPTAGTDWAGAALVRGGYWHGEDYAGVFRLGSGSPGFRRGIVGFRCTK